MKCPKRPDQYYDEEHKCWECSTKETINAIMYGHYYNDIVFPVYTDEEKERIRNIIGGEGATIKPLNLK